MSGEQDIDALLSATAPARPAAVAAAPEASAKEQDIDALLAATTKPVEPSTAGPTSMVGMPPRTILTNPPAPLGPLTSAIVGAGAGVGETGLGAAQLAAKGYAATGLPGSETASAAAADIGRHAETAQQNVDILTREHPYYEKGGEIGGGTLTGFMLPGSKVAEGANLVNRLTHAAIVGGELGAGQPVSDAEKNFWGQKAGQTVLGTIGGAVGGAIGEGVGTVAGATMRGARAAGSWLSNLFGGGAKDASAAGLDQATQDALGKASPELQAKVGQAVQAGEPINKTALSRQLEADSLPVPVRLTAGQASGDAIQISNELNTRSLKPDVVQHLQEQEANLGDNLTKMRQNFSPNANAETTFKSGNDLRDAVQSVLDAQDAKTSALYKQLADANGGNLPMDGQAFAGQANAALAQQMKSAFVPARINAIMNEFLTGGRQMTFENFENLRTILAAEGRAAERSGDGNTGAAIGTIRTALEQMPLTGDQAALKGLADQARASAKYGFDLRRIPAFKGAESGADPDKFIEQYVVNGKSPDVRNLAVALQDSPAALQAMKAGTINYLRDQAGVAAGKFRPDSFGTAWDNLRSKQDVLFGPDEKSQLQTLANVARYTSARPKGNFVNTSNTDVANLARTGAGFVDTMTGLKIPIASFLVGKLQAGASKKAVDAAAESSLGVGAGVTGPSAAEKFARETVPGITRQLGVAAGNAAAQDQSVNWWAKK